MAKYQITHSCGHTSERDMVGKLIDRESKISSLQKHACPNCSVQERVQAAMADHTLPQLVGTDKQIAWAHDVRASQVQKARNFADMIRHHLANPPTGQEQEAERISRFVSEHVEAYFAESAASEWIERRHGLPLAELFLRPALTKARNTPIQ